MHTYRLIKLFLVYLFVSVPLFLLFRSKIDKYEVELVDTKRNSKAKFFFHEDLDGDGNSEEVQIINYYAHTSVMVSNEKGIIDQWNFTGIPVNIQRTFTEDYDNDGVKEVFIFTTRNDSVLFHCLDPVNKLIDFKNKKICKPPKYNGRSTYVISLCSAWDANSDGYKELFFYISSGYGIKPRNVFAYYPKEDTVLVSPESCAAIGDIKMYDLDKDEIPEFIASNNALGNCNLESAYTDMYSWLMVYTPDMKFKFPPKRFDAYPAESEFMPFNAGGVNYIFGLHMYRGTGNYKSFLALFDPKGKLLRKKYLKYGNNFPELSLMSRKRDFSEILLINRNGLVYRVDTMLNIHRFAELKRTEVKQDFKEIDIELDGEDEFIFKGVSLKELILYRNDFSNPVILKFPENFLSYYPSVIRRKGELPKIFINTNDYLYTFSYKQTLFYTYRYAVFLPLFLLLLITVFVAGKIKDYRALKIKHTQKVISELQMKAIQNQIDPHFTFNIFTSFNSLIVEKDIKRANHIFNKYVGLLRTTVFNADNIRISLQEEINFIKDYLDLEKFRYHDKFLYKINIDEKIDMQMLVPKMSVHLFVENAIKHGLRHLDKGGLLEIEAIRKHNEVHLTIADNGVGREKAKKYATFSTGKGLHIMDKILENYFNLYRVKISYKIIDLFENNKAAGTRIEIKIPLE